MDRKYIILYMISVLLSSFSQILLKYSTKKKHKSFVYEYFNIYVVTSYSIFIIATILTTLAYKGIALSFGQVLEASGYIYIVILSRVILKEKITIKKIVGNILIIIGIFIFTL